MVKERGIADTFGVKLVIDRTARSNQELYENLARGRYDMVASKFSMTPERAMGEMCIRDRFKKKKIELLNDRLIEKVILFTS